MKLRRPVVWYCVFAYGIAWLIWGIALLFPTIPLVTGIPVSIFVMLGMFAPLMSTLLVQRFVQRTPTGISWRVRLRGNLRRYLLALWGPALLTFLGGAVYYAIFTQQFDAEMGYFTAQVAGTQRSAVQQALWAQISLGILCGGFMNAIPALGEEAGWRGFLAPALTQRFGPVKGLILTGVIWGLWHAPLTVMGHNYGTGYIGWPVTGLLAMCAFCIASGICLTWLTQKTGSIWPAALCHGAINAIGAAPSIFLAQGAAPVALLGPNIAGLITGIPLFILATFALWKMHCSTQKGKA